MGKLNVHDLEKNTGDDTGARYWILDTGYSTNVLGNTQKHVWGKNTDNSDLKVIQKN